MDRFAGFRNRFVNQGDDPRGRVEGQDDGGCGTFVTSEPGVSDVAACLPARLGWDVDLSQFPHVAALREEFVLD